MKKKLWVYLTGHPIEAREELQAFNVTPIANCDLREISGPEPVANIGMHARDAVGLCRLTLDDRSARFEVMVSGDLHEQVRDKLVSDTLILCEGRVSFDERN